jgi:hypothetical protein
MRRSRRRVPWLAITGVVVLAVLVYAAVIYVAGQNTLPGLVRPPAVRPVGFLHTSGTQILDDQGQSARLTGVNIEPLRGGYGGHPDPCGDMWEPVPDSDIVNISRLGFNSVRLKIEWDNAEPAPPTVEPDGTVVHHWYQPYLEAIDSAVHRFGAAQVKVIISAPASGLSSVFTQLVNANGNPNTCGSGLPVWMLPDYQAANRADDVTNEQKAKCEFFANHREDRAQLSPWTGWSDFMTMLADRYKQDATVVGLEVWSEPTFDKFCSTIGQDVTNFYNTVGPQIHAANPNLLLFYQDSTYGGYVNSGYLLTGKMDVPNAVYTWHWYPNTWQEGLPPLQAHVARARAFGQPLWIGEFNGFNYQHKRGGNEDPNWKEDTESFMSYAKQNHLSWSYYLYRVAHTPPLPPDLVPVLQSGIGP